MMAICPPFPYPGIRRMAIIGVTSDLLAEALKLPPGSIILGGLASEGSDKYRVVRLVVEHPDLPVVNSDEAIMTARVEFEVIRARYRVVDDVKVPPEPEMPQNETFSEFEVRPLK